MKINLGDFNKLGNVEVRKYPADQQKLLDFYSNELVEMGFMKVRPTPSWQTAPHLVPKDAKTKYKTSVDLRPVKDATKAEQWSM